MEIDDKEVENLRRASNLLQALYADPGLSVEFQRIVKKKFPNAQTPTLDVIEAGSKAQSDLKAEIEKLSKDVSGKIDGFLEARKKEQEEAQVNAFADRFGKVVKDRGYTKEGEEKLLAIMKERGIQNPEDAAILFEASQPKETRKPRPFSTRMDFVSASGEKDEALEKLLSDPEQYMMDELTSALSGAGAEE